MNSSLEYQKLTLVRILRSLCEIQLKWDALDEFQFPQSYPQSLLSPPTEYNSSLDPDIDVRLSLWSLASKKPVVGLITQILFYCRLASQINEGGELPSFNTHLAG